MAKRPGGVSFVGRASLSQRVLYRRFHCIAYIAVFIIFEGVCIAVMVIGDGNGIQIAAELMETFP